MRNGGNLAFPRPVNTHKNRSPLWLSVWFIWLIWSVLLPDRQTHQADQKTGRIKKKTGYGARPREFFQFSMPLSEGVAEAALYCAHRTSTFLSCAFCEREGRLADPAPSLQVRSLRYPTGWPGLALNCARRARPFLGRALREQKGPTRLPTISTHPRSSLPERLFTQWDDPNSRVLLQIQHRLIARDNIVSITFFCALQNAVIWIVRQNLDRVTRLHNLGHFGQRDSHVAQLVAIMAEFSG